jgi:hypothetical protein
MYIGCEGFVVLPVIFYVTLLADTAEPWKMFFSLDAQ